MEVYADYLDYYIKKDYSSIFDLSSFKPLPKDHKEILRKEKFKFPKDSFLILITGIAYKNHETALKVLQELRTKKSNIYIVRLGQKDKDWDKLKKKLFS